MIRSLSLDDSFEPCTGDKAHHAVLYPPYQKDDPRRDPFRVMGEAHSIMIVTGQVHVPQSMVINKQKSVSQTTPGPPVPSGSVAPSLSFLLSLASEKAAPRSVE